MKHSHKFMKVVVINTQSMSVRMRLTTADCSRVKLKAKGPKVQGSCSATQCSSAPAFVCDSRYLHAASY